MPRDAVIAACLCSPFTFARKGPLAAVRPDDPGAWKDGAATAGSSPSTTGGRLVGKAASLLKRERKSNGPATRCIRGGMGIAMVLEAA
jgi:hypothetical protein